jgi:hypothetical protein
MRAKFILRPNLRDGILAGYRAAGILANLHFYLPGDLG